MTGPRRTPNKATTTQPAESSRKAAHKSPLGWLPWLLLALLLLLIAGIIAALLLFNNDDDSVETADVSAGASAPAVAPVVPDVSTPDPDFSPPVVDVSSAPDASPPSVDQASPPAGATGQADLLVGQQDLLALSGGSLGGTESDAVTGTATVQSVVADSGFWVGPSADKRVYVFLTRQARGGQAESPFKVTAGQQIDITGTLLPTVAHQDVVDGVTDAEGRALLDRQGQYVSASKVDLG